MTPTDGVVSPWRKEEIAAARSCDPVLVVEDDDDVREILKQVLEMRGYAVETACDGLEALEIVRRTPSPSVVLLDLLLPQISGWEFVHEVSKNERLSRIPIIVMSGLVRTKEKRLPQATAYLSKPINLKQLFLLVEELC